MRKDLISMGYKEMKKDIWGKPVGFNLFTFEVITLTWTNWLMGTNQTQLVWNSDVYEADDTVKDDFLTFIKYSEAWTRLVYRDESKYEFLTLQEQISELL